MGDVETAEKFEKDAESKDDDDTTAIPQWTHVARKGGRVFGMRLEIQSAGRTHYFFIVRNVARRLYEKVAASSVDPLWKWAVLYSLLEKSESKADWISIAEIETLAKKVLSPNETSTTALTKKVKQLLQDWSAGEACNSDPEDERTHSSSEEPDPTSENSFDAAC